MKRIATATVIRGNGACEAYINDIVNKEIMKMNEQHEMELSRRESEMEAIRNHRDKLLADKMVSLTKHKKSKFKRFWKRVKDSLELAWCRIWIMGCILGLWTYDDSNGGTV